MKSVVICASNKFAKEARAFAKGLEKLGAEVLIPPFYRASGGDLEALSASDRRVVAAGLVHDHFHKIRQADVVFIFNKDGYAGNSTNIEIGYAAALNKPIYAFSNKDSDPGRAILFQGVAKKPKELVEKLK
ncbi:MAG: hypothetical protein UY63_C0005G0008 [Parcubacteria group bacterium GW2011_GWA2_51_10]|nr:MAG: hypothetical protein UY63_C0005G0008 [Parcubacteria group bacterium GW2011_GWA2_51_10]